jgi:hypothetical protein
LTSPLTITTKYGVGVAISNAILILSVLGCDTNTSYKRSAAGWNPYMDLTDKEKIQQ